MCINSPHYFKYAIRLCFHLNPYLININFLKFITHHFYSNHNLDYLDFKFPLKVALFIISKKVIHYYNHLIAFLIITLRVIN